MSASRQKGKTREKKSTVASSGDASMGNIPRSGKAHDRLLQEIGMAVFHHQANQAMAGGSRPTMEDAAADCLPVP